MRVLIEMTPLLFYYSSHSSTSNALQWVRLNSPVSNSSRLLNRSTEDSFVQGWPRPVECNNWSQERKSEKTPI